MLKVKAHAKSVDGKSIQIILYDPSNGSVKGTHTINEAPTLTAPEGQMSGVQHVEAFLDRYHQSNPDDGVVAYTVENFARMSVMPGTELEEWKEGSGLVEPIEEVGSAKEIKTPTGNEPKVIAAEDGTPAIEGATVVVKPPPDNPESPEAERLRRMTSAENPEDVILADATSVMIKSSPAPIGQLPQFMSGDPEWYVGMTPEEMAEELENYGNLLGETILVAGDDFSLPDDFRGEEPAIPPAEPTPEPEPEEEKTPEDPDAKAEPQPKKKRAVQTDGISKDAEAKLSTMSKKEANRNKGVGGDPIVEPVPGFVQARTEKVISHKYNTWIVMGRDRADPDKASRASGYGGRGNTQCGAIDIVVGRMSPRPLSVGRDGKKVSVDPIFNLAKSGKEHLCDAARIYISQKTDVDKNFRLAKGRVGMAEARSAIAMKADGIRIMAREGIKLVTHADKMNSQGGTITRIRGVDIIAGNNENTLQPMVLGNNMRECIEEMAQVLSEVCGTLANVCTNVAELDTALSTHFHPSPFFGAPTLPSPTVMPVAVASLIKLASVDMFSTAAQKFNIARIKQLYTGPGAKKPIRSKHNNVN